jgi:hypothetical protein
MEHAWKACVLERVPRVRIPHSPQKLKLWNQFIHITQEEEHHLKQH